MVIQLAIADDHTLFRKGVTSIVEAFSGVEMIIEADNGKELITKMKKRQPDVILMDLKMPVMDGVEATKKIRETNQKVKILALSMHDNERFVYNLIENGANGYLLKYADPQELEEAIKTVVTDGFYFNDHVSKALFKGLMKNKSIHPNFNTKIDLTEREIEVLKLICSEHTNVEIAAKMEISVRTVEGHRTKLIEKVGARNTVGLVLFAIKAGYVS
jgi:DNA-binding NarL/FixJ family response regulator